MFARPVQSLEKYLTILAGSFTLTAGSGAVASTKGKEFTVAKGGANSGEYTVTLDTDLRFQDSQILGIFTNLVGLGLDQDVKCEAFNGPNGTLQIQLFVPSTGLALADAAVVASTVQFMVVAKNTNL